MIAQLSKQTRPAWEKREDMFPRAGDGAQLVDGLPRMHKALAPSPVPHRPSMGVPACNSDGEKKDHKFKVIQGQGYRRPCFRDTKEENREGTEGSHLWQGYAAAPFSMVLWGGWTQPPHSTQDSLFFLLPCCASLPLGSLEEVKHPHYCNYCQPLPPQEI